MKRRILLILLSGLLALAGCSRRNQPATGQETVTVTVVPTPSESPIITQNPEKLPEASTEPVGEPENRILSEETLVSYLEEEEGVLVITQVYDDFDNDGSYEMFAFVSEPEYLVDYDSLYGKVVFLDSELQLTELTTEFAVWDDASIRTVALENRLLFVADEAFVSETASRVYAVYENEPVCLLSNLGYFDEQDGALLLTVSDYDMCVEYDGFSTGHTWKTYYLYYVETEQCFREYLAEEITEEGFLAYEGADELLASLRAQYPHAEYEFLLRENGMLHINLIYDAGGYLLQKNVTVDSRDGKLTNPVENDGRYHQSCLPW